MSWQLGAFTVLAIALAGGFAWYERTRPDARVIALVGTLAAFAALGRVAFAALPNVKPTSDIVLISGYALGGAPGFVVGALAGLTSNFFFGQGPWTPWQMAAWGATGVLGAWVAAVTRGKIGRWQLALVCALAGYAFTAVQDVGDWVTYSDHSLAQLGVYVGKGTAFDFVHAAGCLVFALAFGPALARSVARCASRLQMKWGPAQRSVALGAVALVTISAAGRAALPPSARAAATPSAYLLAAQNSDGGFGPAPGSSSSQLYSGWAALGLAAAGDQLQSIRHGGPSIIDYIAGGTGSLDVGSLERTILVVRSAGMSASNFAGQNLLDELEGDVGGDGSVSGQVNLTSFAVLALRAAGASPPAAMLSWLEHQDDADGGFNFESAPGTSDVDDTGAALEALAGVPGGLAAQDRSRAVAFISGQQNRDGGFPADPGDSSNAQSTAWAVQGLLAAGVDPNSSHRRGAPSPLQYLQSLIAPDGHVSYSSSSDQTPVWVTAEVLMALEEKPLPLAPVARGGGGGSGGGPAAQGPGGRSGRAGSDARAAGARLRRRRSDQHITGSEATLAADAGVAFAVALGPVGTD